MQFLVKDILNNKNLHQTFVRTTFLGSPVGTQTTWRWAMKNRKRDYAVFP